MSAFSVGDVIVHQKLNYRGVIVGVDATFSGTDEWYESVARSRPPKDKPWYHVLVHGSGATTYVAERHLGVDPSGDEIDHPLLNRFFDTFQNGIYSRQGALH